MTNENRRPAGTIREKKPEPEPRWTGGPFLVVDTLNERSVQLARQRVSLLEDGTEKNAVVIGGLPFSANPGGVAAARSAADRIERAFKGEAAVGVMETRPRDGINRSNP